MQIENLDHLGLVAGVVDELGLVELTNNQQTPFRTRNCGGGIVQTGDNAS